ncbi:hypothetical protein [Amycolatopsis lurida]|uniref:hypothetical protein n=1 Tax=Amycolatopsis lurida TaxID=31959 RepID=UPI003663F7DC
MPSRDPDGEIDDVDEFLGTLGEVEYDDVLLSILGEGGNLDVSGNVVDQQLANALSSWRDDGDREPVRDEAIGQKHPTGAAWPPATTGGTVSVQDEAERLRSLAASREIPIEILNQASERLDGLMGQVREILGSMSVHLSPLEGLVQEVKGALATAVGAGQQFEAALYVAADAHARG